METINWGILAPGNIANSFAEALRGVPSAHLYSVASRDAGRARAFAQLHDFDTSADSYEALIKDPNVDAIYIASPHTFHAEQSIRCLQAGKAVLCEKPMTINAHEARRVIDAAQQYNTFYMEAVWTRFMPILKQVRRWIDDGEIGEIQLIQASLGFDISPEVRHRLYDPALAGGSLLDVGIYPITFAQWVMQEPPQQIAALAQMHSSGVDERAGIVLRYTNGVIATLNSAITARTSHDAWIFGSKGNIKLPRFWMAEEATLITGEEQTTVSRPHTINGYEGEIEEVHRCLQTGLIESPTMSWQKSLSVMEIMDEVRAQIGLRYPMEA